MTTMIKGINKASEKIWECLDCHNKFKLRQLVQGICYSCQENRLKIQREDARRIVNADLSKYADKLKHCTTGVCDMLQLHHDALKDDPDHLKTDFIIGLVCGDDMRQKYLSKSMGRIH